MELLFPLLFVFCSFVIGWVAGIYLLVQWIKRRRQQSTSAFWVQVWITGWGLSAIGIITQFVETRSSSLLLLMSPLHALGALALYAGPVLWTIAWFLFRKDPILQIASVPEYGKPEEGIWPPPPTDPQG